MNNTSICIYNIYIYTYIYMYINIYIYIYIYIYNRDGEIYMHKQRLMTKKINKCK